MKGKVVLVTGGNGGLGTYVTQAFLDAGATVVGTSRKIQQSEFNNPNFTALQAEISTREGAQTLVDQVVARFGKLDVLAHTVGGFAGGQSIADTDDVTFQ
jgi:NAD(P)-dependent dehydrogenase (short-subunit alcohol dehydrogenase family)